MSHHPNTTSRSQSWPLCLCAVAATVGLFLGNALTTEAQTGARAKPAAIESDGSESVVLLRNGRILKGRIKSVSTGYLVTSKSGYLAINHDEVRFEGKDVGEIYLQLRQELKDPSIKEQLGLAEWCVNQQLYSYADRELQAVLKRDPFNDVAKRLLRRIETDSQEKEDVSSQSKLLTAFKEKTQPDDAARSLGGLSNTVAQQFVGSIQPLLTNKCGNARCHGGESEHAFKLARGASGGGNHRIYAERNLATVLKQVNLTRPAESPLLLVTRGSHAGRPIFAGQGAAAQQKLLSTWIESVAAELRGPVSLSETKLSTALDYESVRGGKTGRLTEPQPTTARATTQPVSLEQSAEAAIAVQDSQSTQPDPIKRSSDAFDPDEFNSKYADGALPRIGPR